MTYSDEVAHKRSREVAHKRSRFWFDCILCGLPYHEGVRCRTLTEMEDDRIRKANHDAPAGWYRTVRDWHGDDFYEGTGNVDR